MSLPTYPAQPATAPVDNTWITAGAEVMRSSHPLEHS